MLESLLVHIRKSETRSRAQRAHAVVKGEALEGVWGRGQALQAFLRCATLILVWGTSPAQSPRDRAAATQAKPSEF